MNKEKVIKLKIRKGQKCWFCKKEIKKSWCYNGHWWHDRCKERESKLQIKEYLNKDAKNI